MSEWTEIPTSDQIRFSAEAVLRLAMGKEAPGHRQESSDPDPKARYEALFFYQIQGIKLMSRAPR